jgi:hypothetical protein
MPITIGTVLLVAAGAYWFLEDRERDRCVTDAERAVSAYLESHPHPSLGAFRRLEGEGYQDPSWGSGVGYYYLVVNRTAHFSNGAEPIKIYVTAASSEKKEVKVSVQGTTFYVAHPKLRAPAW